MLFREFGDPQAPVIVLLHGGGLSWWALEEVIARFRERYLVVAPVIDGHGEDYAQTFQSIEDSARKLLSYIDKRCGGRVFALGGLSLGAQIAVEVLSERNDAARFAVFESALVIPAKAATALMVPAYHLAYGLIRRRWFSSAQARAMNLPDRMFERYYADSARMSKETLIRIALSNGNYALKPSISGANAKVLILAGERELPVMKRSARKLHEAIPGSKLRILKAMGHGDISQNHSGEYAKLLEDLFADRNP